MRSRSESAALKSKLARLERTLDADTKHLRRHREELLDIQALFAADEIDRPHAEYLAERSKAIYEAAEAKIKGKNKPLPNVPVNPLDPNNLFPGFYRTDNRPWYKRWFTI